MVEDPVEAVRRFSRFYTARIGALQEGLLHSPFSLAEARVLFELATGDGRIARELAAELRLDAGYLSRLLRRLAGRGLIDAGRSDGDRRVGGQRIVGSVMLVDGGDGVARLRLLLVEPEARGLGRGRRLTDECIRFAQSVGYARITLWTQSIFSSASTRRWWTFEPLFSATLRPARSATEPIGGSCGTRIASPLGAAGSNPT